MDNSNTTLFMPPAAFPDTPRRVDLSLIVLILALMAVIMLPTLIYAFFFAVKFPPWPNSDRNHQQSSDELSTDNSGGPGPGVGADRVPEPVPGVKYQRESHVKEIGSDCPVCLSIFADGEEVRQLTACKHAFHTTCIDSWLNNHSSCPICRASVTVKKPSGRTAAPRRRDYYSMRQGLPDAASLV
ncbi:hypothetical protein SLE2022_075730 [Rubroshorea leprosula]